MTECEVCGRPMADQGYVCAGDARRLQGALERAAALAPELDTTIARQGRSGSGGGRARGAEPPLPYAPVAADAGWAAGNTITTWCRHVSETRGRRLPTMPTGPVCWGHCIHATCATIRDLRHAHPIAVAARWLVGHLEWLRHQPEAVEAWDELHDACALLARTVDRHDPGTLVGACQCGQYVYSHQGRDHATCRDCGQDYDVAKTRAELRRRLDDRLMTAAEIATMALHLELAQDRQLARKVINVWSARGVIEVRARVDDIPRYRFGEVIARFARGQVDIGRGTVTAQRAGDVCPGGSVAAVRQGT